jgi:phosphomannomutase
LGLCDQLAMVDTYCRYHYLLLWKKIQIRKSILLDGKLEKYIEDLTSRYPDKFLEMIKKDMKTEKVTIDYDCTATDAYYMVKKILDSLGVEYNIEGEEQMVITYTIPE